MRGSKRWWALAAVAGVVGLILYLSLGGPTGSSSSSARTLARAGADRGVGADGGPDGGTSETPEGEGLRSRKVDLGPPEAEFEEARVNAMKMWRFELQRQLQQCMPQPGPDPRPLLVGFTVAYDARLSTPVLQRYVVMNVNVPPDSPKATPAVRSCLNRAVGTTVNIPVSKDLLPEVERQMHDVIAFPL